MAGAQPDHADGPVRLDGRLRHDHDLHARLPRRALVDGDCGTEGIQYSHAAAYSAAAQRPAAPPCTRPPTCPQAPRPAGSTLRPARRACSTFTWTAWMASRRARSRTRRRWGSCLTTVSDSPSALTKPALVEPPPGGRPPGSSGGGPAAVLRRRGVAAPCGTPSRAASRYCPSTPRHEASRGRSLGPSSGSCRHATHPPARPPIPPTHPPRLRCAGCALDPGGAGVHLQHGRSELEDDRRLLQRDGSLDPGALGGVPHRHECPQQPGQAGAALRAPQLLSRRRAPSPPASHPFNWHVQA